MSAGQSAAPAEDVDEPAGASILAAIREWVVVLVGAVVLALVVRAFVLQAFSIPSESMETTLLVGDHVVVDKLAYRLGDIDRFDVVVFDKPPELTSSYDELIKRVIGLPGDTVEGREGAVWINGAPIDEPYLDPGVTILDFPAEVVPDGHLFLMGDNRNRSSDSRVFGPVDAETVVGQARIRYWPLSRLGGL